MKTKFGNVGIDGEYYRVTSINEGNQGKLWHRLIFEDFYNFTIPKGYHIHHKNGNKLDNCILNLQLINASDHPRLHNTGLKRSVETIRKMSDVKKGENNPMYDQHHSLESRKAISKSSNSTGYFRVGKDKNKKYKQGFIYQYRYYENGKPKKIRAIDIKVLEAKVKAKGLEWFKLDGDN